jgi:hypothetical protein
LKENGTTGDNGNGIIMINLLLEIFVTHPRAINLYKDKEHLNALKYRNEYRSFLGKACQEYIEVL